MKIFNTLKLSVKFAVLIGTFVLGFVVYGGWSFKTLNELKVNGPIYHQIIQGKDLIADILPPPAYIIESYLTTLQLANENDKAEQDKLIVRLKNLKSDYDLQHDFWSKKNLGNEIDDAFLKKSHTPALDFYNIAFESLIPAVQRNDRDGVKASMSQIKSKYEAHRNAIDQVIKIAEKRNLADESMANEKIRSANIFLIFVLIISMITALTITALVLRSLMQSLGAEPYILSAASKKIAEGALDSNFSLSAIDKSSVMYQIDKMRIQLKQRFELERDTTEANLRAVKAEKEKQFAEERSLRVTEKQEIYISVAQAAHHILNNLLNQFLLFKMEAEKSNDFDKDIIKMFNDASKEANDLLYKLSNITQVTTENINDSVAPKLHL